MKLVNRQIQVAGDQWPVFLYANYTYDAEDPWNGLLCSGLLISVGIFGRSQLLYVLIIKFQRHSSTSSHLPAPLTRNQRPHDLEMRASMVCRLSQKPLLLMWPHKYAKVLVILSPSRLSKIPGMLCTDIGSGLLSYRSCY